MVTRSPRPGEARILPILLFSATLTVMAGAIIAPGLNRMMDALGVGTGLGGLIITTHGIGIALFSPVMGALIDRVDPHGPYAAGLILYGVAGGAGLLIDDSIFRRTPALLGVYGLMFMTNVFLYAIVIFVPRLMEGLGHEQPFLIGLMISSSVYALVAAVAAVVLVVFLATVRPFGAEFEPGL